MAPDPLPSLCRDCGTTGIAGDLCPKCRHRRIVRHPELLDLAIAHIDCDAFYAAVEKRDNPELRDKPVIIGGEKRGVVSTACYIARIKGVHSAMPMFKALKACPEAVVIKPNMAKYAAVGREIRTMMEDLTPLVEPLSIDEAFLDLSGTERVHHAPPAVTLAHFARRIEREVGITVSIGLAGTKFLAKMASDMDKPRGYQVIGNAEALALLAAQPVGRIWGVGKAMQNRLLRDGFTSVGDLQKAPRDDLFRRYGVLGYRLSDLSHNIDTRKVSPNRPTKSVSSETTFNTDIADLDALERTLFDLSEKVSRRMKKAGFSGRTVTVKLKDARFRTKTRSRTLDAPTQIADRIYRVGHELMAPEVDGTAYRLIGIGLSDLTTDINDDTGDLFDPGARKRAAAERAVDAVRGRFGIESVGKGLNFRSRPRPDRVEKD